MLDPIADKLLVASVLLVLVGVDLSGASILPAAIILCREILVSGLREFLAQLQVSVPVTRLSKWKTTIQMVAIGFLVIGDAGAKVGPLDPQYRGRRFVGSRGADFGHGLRLPAGGTASRWRRSRLSRRSAIEAGRSRRRRMSPE